MQKLFVFDLDFTLWNAGGTWCDHTSPPYKRVNSHVEDSYGSRIELYPEVLEILNRLEEKNIPMAVASRTGAPSWALQLLQLFEIDHFFPYKEIYPAIKTKHFDILKKQTGFSFSNMVFFDDEMRNIHEVGALGVQAIYVENGLSWQMVEEQLV